ncbi:MAG TPA: hypothetical protein VJQ47_04475 [Steroidobacteraceae bacterium]|nr:hypothetical protein [Steroidobacteraceae bacterium]
MNADCFPAAVPSLVKRTALRHPLTALASLAMLGASVSGCAATPTTYNPDKLDSVRYERVAEICQKVMGLSPSEPLDGGNWLGNDRLDYWTSHYRGCVLSLSDSVQKVADEKIAQRADEDCRAKGLKEGTANLALCVLRTVNDHPASAAPSAAMMVSVSDEIPPVAKSYFRASPGETVRREKVACAALGFEPTQGTFQSCVKGLDDTFYSIDHPVN